MSELYIGTPDGIQKLGGEKELNTLNLGNFLFGTSSDAKTGYTILDGENYEKIKNAKFVIVNISSTEGYGQVMLINGKSSSYRVVCRNSSSVPVYVYDITIAWNSGNNCINASVSYGGNFSVYFSFSLVYFE